MPEIKNYSNFPNFRYYSQDNNGTEFGVIIVKATYELLPNGQLAIAEEQAPMLFSDRFHGEMNLSSLWHPSDLVPNKPKTDIIVNAIAFAPNGVPTRTWNCGLAVVDGGKIILDKKLTVHGPRMWVPRWKRKLNENERQDWRRYRRAFDRWEIQDGRPVDAIPLRYEQAFGGTLARGNTEGGQPVIDDVHENPIGCGWIDRDWTDHTIPQMAPQIEAADDPIRDPYRRYQPQGLGPIPCAWEPRLPLGGTYDQHWIDHVWPNWAEDYSFLYHNSANPDLITEKYLSGNEFIRLTNLIQGTNSFDIKLPGDEIYILFDGKNAFYANEKMNLDTVFLDIGVNNLQDARIYMSWRLNFQTNIFRTATIIHQVGNEAPLGFDAPMATTERERRVG